MALEKVGVRATIEGLSAFESGMRRMDRSVDKYGDAALTASKRTKTLTDALKKVGLGLVAAAAASGALLFSSVKLAARVETLGVVTKVLGKNVGKTEEEIRALEKAIVDEGITLRTARKSIALMIQSNVDLTKSTKLATLAQNAAVIAGINSSEAFERLIFVITSGNVRMARTLGLQVSFAQGMERMAEATGKTAASLTPLERITARTEEVLRAGVNIADAYAEAMGTVGKAVTSLPRFIEESKVALGEAWLPVYAEVVGFVTDSLKAWLALDQSQRDVISTTLGMVTAITGLLGVTALLGAALPAAITGLTSLGVAMGIVASGTAAGLAIMGLLVVAIVAVGAAFISIINTFNQINRGIQMVNDAWDEHVGNLLKSTMSYEEIRAEMIRAGLEVAKVRLRLYTFNKIMKESGEEAVLAAAGIHIFTQEEVEARRWMIEYNAAATEATETTKGFTDSQIEGAKELKRTAAAIERTTKGMEWRGDINRIIEERANKLRVAQERLREEEERLRKEQELLRGELALISQQIGLDLAPKFEDYQEKIKETKKEIRLLIKEIRKNEEEELDTKHQEASLSRLRESLGETREAWNETTKNMIFNLAEQRLAIDGFTTEEIAALRQLAGPEGLGLIDAPSVALLEKIDLIAVAMEKSGDQSDLFAEDMVGLQQMMLDPTASAEALADAINSIESKTVEVYATVNVRTVQTGAGLQPSEIPAIMQEVLKPKYVPPPLSPSRLPSVVRDTGGFLQAGQAAVVGGRGPEIFAPRQSGMILSNRFVGAINSLVAAIRSVPALMSAPMTPAVSTATTTNNFEMNINSSAPTEQVAMDFQMMRAIASRRR